MSTTIEIKGELAKEVRSFLEDQKRKKESPFRSVPTKEKGRSVGAGKEAGVVEALVLVLTIGQDLLRDLIVEFFKEKIRGGNHSARYKIKADDGSELEITLNGLKLEEVGDIVANFKGNVAELNSVQD
jgi:hypothetical protein